MIHPARFLFDAGDTDKKWNKKMLEDPHFKVLDYKDGYTLLEVGSGTYHFESR